LVKEWTGKELNCTHGDESSPTYVWALPCDEADTAQSGWSYDDVQKNVKARNGQCITYDTDSAGITLTLEDCRVSSLGQYLAYDNTTQLFKNPSMIAPPPYQDHGMCLSVFGWQLPTCGTEPSAKLYPCLGDQTDQKWTMESKNASIRDACGYCLSYRRHIPQSPGTVVQMWVKPQPTGVAVLMINNSPDQQQFPIDFVADLGLRKGEPVRVRDIWEREYISEEPIKSGKYEPALPPYESGFFLMEPMPTPPR
jgi:hypothetical protein